MRGSRASLAFVLDALDHAGCVARLRKCGRDAYLQSSIELLRKPQAHKRRDRPWELVEKCSCRTWFEGGVPIHEIVRERGRTLQTSESRLEVMGLITRAEHPTKDIDA